MLVGPHRRHSVGVYAGFTSSVISRLVELAGATLVTTSRPTDVADKCVALLCRDDHGDELTADEIQEAAEVGDHWRVVSLRWLVESIVDYRAKPTERYEVEGQTQVM